jgi:hypothetical protein
VMPAETSQIRGVRPAFVFVHESRCFPGSVPPSAVVRH